MLAEAVEDGSGGGTDSASDESSEPAVGDHWPLTITDDAGHQVTIDEKPKTIASTAVTLTGSALAIDAPVKASDATMPNSPVADD